MILGSSSATPQKNQALPRTSEFVRFFDPVTENPVVRLTSPSYAHFLPSPANSFICLKPRALYCSSNRSNGRLAPFQIDLRGGQIRQLAETAALDPSSLCLDSQGRMLYFLDGGQLFQVSTTGHSEKKHLEVRADGVSAYSLGAARNEIFAIRQGRLQRIAGDERTLTDNAVGPCLARPNGNGCLFTRTLNPPEQEFWYIASDSSKPVRLASGRISDPFWSPTGESLFFLRDVPKNNVFVAELHEIRPEDPVERYDAATSQFAAFSANSDSSVFVGSSKSKAQPNIILLLRATRRELTLCEHGASVPSAVSPVFSPDSRRVYFQSDREGKAALYSVNVESLVEPTGG